MRALNDQTMAGEGGTGRSWRATDAGVDDVARREDLWRRPMPWLVYLIAAVATLPALWYLLVGPGGVYVVVNGERAKMVWHLGGMMSWVNAAPPRWVDVTIAVVHLAVIGSFAMRWRVGFVAMLAWLGIHVVGSVTLLAATEWAGRGADGATAQAVEMARVGVVPSIIILLATAALVLSPMVRGVFWLPEQRRMGRPAAVA